MGVQSSPPQLQQNQLKVNPALVEKEKESKHEYRHQEETESKEEESKLEKENKTESHFAIDCQ